MADFEANDPRRVWQAEPIETPLMSPVILRDKLTRLHAESAKRRLAVNVGLGFNVVLFLVVAFVFSHPVLRLGSLLTSLGWFVVLRQLRRRDAAGLRAVASVASTGIDSYRRSLERERDFAAAWPWFLVAVPGPMVYIVGTTLQYPATRPYLYGMLGALVGLVAVGVAVQTRRTRRYQRELDDVAQLQEERR